MSRPAPANPSSSNSEAESYDDCKEGPPGGASASSDAGDAGDADDSSDSSDSGDDSDQEERKYEARPSAFSQEKPKMGKALRELRGVCDAIRAVARDAEAHAIVADLTEKINNMEIVCRAAAAAWTKENKSKHRVSTIAEKEKKEKKKLEKEKQKMESDLQKAKSKVDELTPLEEARAALCCNCGSRGGANVCNTNSCKCRSAKKGCGDSCWCKGNRPCDNKYTYGEDSE